MVSCSSQSLSECPDNLIDDTKPTIEIYCDFVCPFCSAVAGLNEDIIRSLAYDDPDWLPIVPILRQNYSEEFNIIFKHYSMHGQESQLSSEAAECARDQCKFWEYHDLLYQNRGNFSMKKYLELASILDLDLDRFGSCLDSRAKEKLVLQQTDEAYERKIRGTPTLFIGGWKVRGAKPFYKIEPYLDKALRGEPAPPAPKVVDYVGDFEVYEPVEVCKKDGKVEVYIFTSSKRDDIDFFMNISEQVSQEKVNLYLWDIMTSDNLLTKTVEESMPKEISEAYAFASPRFKVPTIFVGCKYALVGNISEEGFSNNINKVIEIATS